MRAAVNLNCEKSGANFAKFSKIFGPDFEKFRCVVSKCEANVSFLNFFANYAPLNFVKTFDELFHKTYFCVIFASLPIIKIIVRVKIFAQPFLLIPLQNNARPMLCAFRISDAVAETRTFLFAQ